MANRAHSAVSPGVKDRNLFPSSCTIHITVLVIQEMRERDWSDPALAFWGGMLWVFSELEENQAQVSLHLESMLSIKDYFLEGCKNVSMFFGIQLGPIRCQTVRHEPSCSPHLLLKFGTGKEYGDHLCCSYFLWDHSGSSTLYWQEIWVSRGVFRISF